MKLQEIELRNKTFVAMVCSIIAGDFLALLPYVSGIAILGNTYICLALSTLEYYLGKVQVDCNEF